MANLQPTAMESPDDRTEAIGIWGTAAVYLTVALAGAALFVVVVLQVLLAFGVAQ